MPVHIAYLVIIIIGVIPKAAKAECSRSVVYPPIMIAIDSLNLFVYLLSLSLHKMKYFIEWNIIADDSALTAKEFEENTVKKL